ncbi:MAG: hypothetical protein AAF514_11935 [Verrucomicrobiota bacterium]
MTTLLRRGFPFPALAAGVLCLSLLPCPAEGPSFALPRFLKSFDVDGDGVLSNEEFAVSRQQADERRKATVDEWDSDLDGFLDHGETEDAQKEILDELLQIQTGFFDEADANGDGILSKVEFGAVPGSEAVPEWIRDSLFSGADVDGNGSITPEEFDRIFGGVSVFVGQVESKDPKDLEKAIVADLNRSFIAMDVNGDGSVSHSEYAIDVTTGAPEMAQMADHFFSQLDENADGQVTLTEYTEPNLPVDPFQVMDDDGNGQLSLPELVATGLTEEFAHQFFGAFDTNGDGGIISIEFDLGTAAPPAAQPGNTPENLDANGDGVLDRSELENSGMPVEIIDQLIQFADLDGNGTLTASEFFSLGLQ